VEVDRGASLALSGLTMLELAGALRSDPEPARGVIAIFIISRPPRGSPRRGESPLSGAGASCP
jgi:hypothetical protein